MVQTGAALRAYLAAERAEFVAVLGELGLLKALTRAFSAARPCSAATNTLLCAGQAKFCECLPLSGGQNMAITAEHRHVRARVQRLCASTLVIRTWKLLPCKVML